MYTVLISVFAGMCVTAGLALPGFAGWGWSVFLGVLAFGACQGVATWQVQKRAKAVVAGIQAIMAAGQKQIQAKQMRWQTRPSGSPQSMMAEIMRDVKVFVKDAIAATESLRRFEKWAPGMNRQIATIQFGLYWQIKDFKKVDELLPKIFLLDPMLPAMKIARMYMLGRPSAEIAKVYEKAVRRLRYNQNVPLAAVWSWVLVQRKDVDGAFKVLVRALANSDNETLKANRDTLANNRVAHFSNAALGEQWYGLFLEEPRLHMPRSRMQWR
ncbi:MAG: hypothetical protein ACI4Q3_05405 [Kiritimatiellia bacterium]